MYTITKYLFFLPILIFFYSSIYAYNINYGDYFFNETTMNSSMQSKVFSPIVPDILSPMYNFYENKKPIERQSKRAIYITSNTAGYPPRFNPLLRNVEKNKDFNSVVIDLKNVFGLLAYTPRNNIKNVTPSLLIKDIEQTIKQIKDKNIFLIGRIVVFKDQEFVRKYPELAIRDLNGNIWRDKNGHSWIDPSSKLIWDYTVDIAKNAYELGFDEINLDYIRFPSDGDLENIKYPQSFYDSGKVKTKTDVIRSFNEYMYKKLKNAFPNKKLSADVFGMVITHSGGLGVGQELDSFIPYYDYISPMIYPSLFPSGFEGIKNPNNNQYQIVDTAIKLGIRNLEKFNKKNGTNYSKEIFRPWVQGYTCVWCAGWNGDLVDIDAQIRALKENDINGYMIWNSSNIYSF